MPEVIRHTALLIEKGVPIPELPRKGRSPVMVAARAMEIGDSIKIPYVRKPVASNMSRTTGFKFCQRREGDSLRIWRIA